MNIIPLNTSSNIYMVIVNSQDKYTKKLVQNVADGKKYPKEIEEKAIEILEMLDNTNTLDVFSNNGYNLEKLHGDLKDFYSVRVNIQYRIIFRWGDGDAYDVKFTNHYK